MSAGTSTASLARRYPTPVQWRATAEEAVVNGCLLRVMQDSRGWMVLATRWNTELRNVEQERHGPFPSKAAAMLTAEAVADPVDPPDRARGSDQMTTG